MHKVRRYNRVALHQARRYKDDISSRLVQVNLFNRSLPPGIYSVEFLAKREFSILHRAKIIACT